MFIQGPTFIIFVKLSKPYVYSRAYVYYFCQNFQALRLFIALRLFRTLEYVIIEFKKWNRTNHVRRVSYRRF